MKKNLTLDLSHTFLSTTDVNVFNERFGGDERKLTSDAEAFTGWVKLPLTYDRAETARILTAAEQIRKQCDACIVIGIGGSYLGARACIEMLAGNTAQPNFGKGEALTKGEGEAATERQGAPAIYFAGFNISGTYHAELIDVIQKKEVCLCIISKSGTTTEPAIAFSVLKDALYRKYGKEEAHKRIYAITDASKGVLRAEADANGYMSFVVPDDIGGRYSVLTPVGLLPIAVAGIDIHEILEGAADSCQENSLTDNQTAIPTAFQYAAVRQLLHSPAPSNAAGISSSAGGTTSSNADETSSNDGGTANSASEMNDSADNLQTDPFGKMIEVYEYYEPKLQYFAEWLKQLFGESEGKEGKGIFPASLQFSADLHSMGQFLQEGSQIFFETVLHVAQPPHDILVPESAGPLLAGHSMNDVNNAAVAGVIAAHHRAGIPIIKIDIPELTPYYFGQLVYFFEKACAIGGYLFGVDPFNQPGVESYKAEMRKALEG